MISDKKYYLLFIFLLVIVFAISHTQSPLYTSNQNTYLLHGLANGGLGYLSHDWITNTTDPFPVFSLLVSLTYSNTSIFLFYIYYAVILGVFIYSIIGITSIVWGIDRSSKEYLTYFVIITSICSGAFGELSTKVFSLNLGEFLQNGLANQYILGPVFQPSTFGVYLLLSIYTFLRNRPFLSVLFLGVAAYFHVTYLLSVAVLTLSYMTLMILEDKNYKKSILIGLLSLIVVAPVVGYSYFSFAPTSPELFSHAQSILIDYRIPHHAKVGVWFGKSALFQIVIVILALLVHRKSRIWLIILIPFIASLSLTLIQVLTESKLLALLFPWRISSFLVPLSAFVLAGGVVSFVFRRYNQSISSYRKTINLFLTTALVLLFISGILISYLKYKNHDKADYIPMMNYVTSTKSKNDIYLIPIWLERFRLHTGVPIFVDKKTHPYKDIEVIDWYSRIQMAEKFYTGSQDSRCNVLRELSFQYGVTHVVINNQDELLNCSILHKTFDDGIFSVYRIKDYK